MKLLYQDISPIVINPRHQSIYDCFKDQMERSEHVEIVVGYVSKKALIELGKLVKKFNIKEIVLTIGMYYFEGMPKSIFEIASGLNLEWQKHQIGEVRLVTAFSCHSKMYCFYKKDKILSSIIGSANLGAIKIDEFNRRQFETSILIEEQVECEDISNLIFDIKSETCSANIQEIKNLKIVQDVNNPLEELEKYKIPYNEFQSYEKNKTDITFEIPLKVPKSADRLKSETRYCTKSNLNVSYAKPRQKKPRNWYESQIGVSVCITRLEGYPERNNPFFIITDDGYCIKAHTSSSDNKQFNAVGNELILGKWIKGRLVDAGVVKPVDNTEKDTSRKGMITQEMLRDYGCNKLILIKTNQKRLDEKGKELDVWLISFEARSKIKKLNEV